MSVSITPSSFFRFSPFAEYKSGLLKASFNPEISDDIFSIELPFLMLILSLILESTCEVKSEKVDPCSPPILSM